MKLFKVIFIFTACLLCVSNAACPFSGTRSKREAKSEEDEISKEEDKDDSHREAKLRVAVGQAKKDWTWRDVHEDLKEFMKKSQSFWPADFGNYGGLLIRLAWHAAGTYRISDGRGGSEGGRQRFEPERSWGDNTNLDKARRILEPIKKKYGDKLSYGDLYIMAGNAAIEGMGGKILGFCAGRVDDKDGSASNMLGPTEEWSQSGLFRCDEKLDNPKNCSNGLGASEMNLIYVNPGGVGGEPDPELSARNIRDVFGRMNMNDRETVSLIGGGHAVGKSHGACDKGAGLPPKKVTSEELAWQGGCGTGIGNDVFTSGYELTFTSRPTYYDNEYFINMLKYEWRKTRGKGGKIHWIPKRDWTKRDPSIPLAPRAHGPTHTMETIGMFTTDYALRVDKEYRKIVEDFAANNDKFLNEFAASWYKLTTRDMGPRARCTNDDAPESQPWQYPLPEPEPVDKKTWDNVKMKIKDQLLDSDDSSRNIGLLLRLGWQCMSSYRDTDHIGGCNGARIRFSPGSDWEVNRGLDEALGLLESIKDMYMKVSMADLIVLASSMALHKATGRLYKYEEAFCPGRVDDDSGEAWGLLKPRVVGNKNESAALIKDYIEVMGLTNEEFYALMGVAYTVGDISENCAGLFCRRQYGREVNEENKFISAILFDDVLKSKEEGINTVDKALRDDEELQKIAKMFRDDENKFLKTVSKAWNKLANFDRFDGPIKKVCDGKDMGHHRFKEQLVEEE